MGINRSLPYIFLPLFFTVGIAHADPQKLYSAAILGRLSEVQGYLDKGLSPNSIAFGGTPVINAAARGGQIEVLKMLLMRGGNANIKSQTSLATPAMAACEGGSLEAVRFLREDALADFTAVDRLGANVLNYAARAGHYHIVKYLTTHGISVAHQDWLGRTPLADAKHYLRHEIAWYLQSIQAPLGYPLEESDWVLLDVPKFRLRMWTPGPAKSEGFEVSMAQRSWGKKWNVQLYRSDRRGLFSAIGIWQAATTGIPKDPRYSEKDISEFSVALIRRIAASQALQNMPMLETQKPTVYDGFKGTEALYTIASSPVKPTTPLQIRILTIPVSNRIYQIGLIFNKERETSRDIRKYYSQIKIDLTRD